MADKPEVMNGETLDIAEQRRNELKQLFPGAFSETAGANGEVVETVDFERLKAELGTFTDVYEGRRERYGMDWPGKRDCMKLIQEPTRATLKPCREESVDFDNTKNLFIEGDNLEVLKLLQKSYYGKVKMIYIDPPYNTGKEFIYSDNYQESLETYLAYAGLLDDDGKKYSTNTASEGRFHTNWLNMMYPRIYLARNMLKDDGLVFISIDENEIGNLRRLCDEIFGEESHLGTFTWKRRQNADNRNQSNVSVDHEYVVLYGKGTDSSLNGVSIDMSKYKNPDNDSRGPWASVDLSGLGNESQRPNLHYNIVDPETGLSYPPNPNRGWSKSKKKVERMIAEGRILFPSKPTGRPREKKFLKELRSQTTGFSTAALSSDVVGYTTNGTREVRGILGGDYFDFPKPVDLLSLLIEQGTDEDDVVLDFFAGSGSFAHAVMTQSSKDKKTRRYIVVQLPESLEESSAAFEAGYRTIADIGKDRIRRVGVAMNEELDQTDLDLEDRFSVDTGFRVYKLDRSTFSQWNSIADLNAERLEEQLELHIDHVDGEATKEEVLYELLIKAGFDLVEEVHEIELGGGLVYSIAKGALMICLEDNLSAALIDAVADTEPMQFICLDKGFNGNDQLKANTVQTFKSKSQNSESELVFKVV